MEQSNLNEMTGGFRWSAGTGEVMVCSPVIWNVVTPLPRPSHRGRQHPSDSVSSAAARGAETQGEGAGGATSQAAGPRDAASLAEPSPLSQAQAWGSSSVPRPHHAAPASRLPGGDPAEAGACRCQRSISLRCELPAGRHAHAPRFAEKRGGLPRSASDWALGQPGFFRAPDVLTQGPGTAFSQT